MECFFFCSLFYTLCLCLCLLVLHKERVGTNACRCCDGNTKDNKILLVNLVHQSTISFRLVRLGPAVVAARFPFALFLCPPIAIDKIEMSGIHPVLLTRREKVVKSLLEDGIVKGAIFVLLFFGKRFCIPWFQLTLGTQKLGHGEK